MRYSSVKSAFSRISPAALTALLVGVFLAAGRMAQGAPPGMGPATRPGSPQLPAQQPPIELMGPIGSLPSVSSTTHPSSQAALTREQRGRVRLLTRRSIELLETKNYPDAEAALTQALAIDPNDSTNLYNMACLKALTGDGDSAMLYLVRSAGAGFTDFDHIETDSDLKSLRNRDDYKFFLSRKDEFQRRAAEMAVKSLQQMFGTSYRYEIDDADKLVFATNTDAVTLEALRQMLVKQARSQLHELFDHKSDQFIIVVLPSLADYSKMVRQPGVEGVYDHDDHILLAKGLGFVTTHEFTHAMHFADIEPLGEEPPIWLVEGLAVMFEHAEYEPATRPATQPTEKPARGRAATGPAALAGASGGASSDWSIPLLVPEDSFRLGYLQAAARMDRLITFHRLLHMSQFEFVRNAGVCYAEAGSIMQYLWDRGLLKTFYETYKADYSQDTTGQMALEKATGEPLAQIDKEWRQWMLHRHPPVLFTGAHGAFLGVQFATANDGIRVQLAIEGGPCYNAGIRAGDVVIGLNDVDVRDPPTFLSMLATHHPSEKITLKIQRGEQYLSVPVVLGRRGDPMTMPGGATVQAKPATKPATRPAAGAQHS